MDNFNEINQDEIEIDLKELFGVLWRKAWLIILVGILFAGAAFAGTKMLITPMYTSTSRLYVLTKSTSVTSLADIQMSSQLTADYQLLSQSRPVVEEVIENLELEYTYKEMLDLITIMNPADTHVLEIQIIDAQPTEAMNIANEMADVVAERVANVMATDKPTIVERAVEAKEPSSPSVMKNTAIGGMLGILLVAGILVVLYILDDTIVDEDDVMKYLQKDVLAVLPKEGKSKKESKRLDVPVPMPKSSTQVRKVSEGMK